MAKIPSTVLKVPFEVNNTDAIITALQYHVLTGILKESNMTRGLLLNEPTLLTDSKYSTITGGQRVTYFKSYDNITTFISGLGTRCTLLKPVCKLPNESVNFS